MYQENIYLTVVYNSLSAAVLTLLFRFEKVLLFLAVVV